jgi:hypothetical protein
MIRLRKANDIATAAHEIGHHLEKTLFGETASGKLGEYGDELSKIATKPKGSPTKAAIEAEGFAEFIAKYVANPEEARKAAPKFYKFFEKEIAAKDPEMHAVLLNAREKVRLWAEQLAQARVLAQIAIGDRPSDLTTRQKWQRLKNKFYEEALDRFNPVKELVKGVEKKSGQKIDFENNPYYLMRLFQGWAGKVEHFLQHATFDYKTYENTGKSLREIIMQTHNLNELRTYLVSRRAIELHVRGIESGIRIEDAKQSVKELGAQYRHISEDLYKYQDALLKMQLDGGLISRDSYEAIKKENAARVPFYRVIEEGENYTLGGKSLKSRRLIKGIKGSTRDIIDPLESIIKDTAEVINAVERNRIGLAIADLAKADKAGEFVFKVPADLKKGQSLEGGEFWQRSETIDKNNEIKVFRDGKAEIYEVDKDIAAIVNGLNPSEANIFMRGMGAFAGMLRAGATGYNPTFAIKNIAKDMLFATTGTKSGFNPFKTLPENIKISVKKSEIYWEMQKAGGGFANLVSLDRNVLQENLRTLTDTGYTGRVWNAISEKQFLKAAKLGMFDPLIGSARYLSETSEQTTRVGEFKSSMKGKEATKANLEKAAFNAREITLDFAKGGNTVRAINTVAAFFNANVQGLIKTGSILADPKRAPKAIAILGTIGILEAVAGWDWETGAEDADIAEVNRTQRDINYVFKAGGVIWRIPKPQNIGYISTGFSMATTALLNSMNKQDNDDLGKNLAKAFWKEFNMNPLPNAISVPIEAWANKSAFFDRPIVPAYAEDMLPEYQYTANTHELTKVISEKLGGFIGRKNTFSPAKAEHMLRGWTGGVGSFLLEASDYSLRKAGMLPDAPKASDTLSDIPFVRAFTIRNPSGSAESVQKFYERYNDTQTYVKTFNFALKSGNVKDAQELAVYAGFKGLDGVNNALRENAALIRNINKNPGISADEKRQAIDNLYFIMTQHAKLGNKMWQEIEAQRKAR